MPASVDRKAVKSHNTPRSGTVAAAAQQGGIGLYEWDASTGELLWDDVLAAMFSADRPEEPPLQTWLRRVHPDDVERVVATFMSFEPAEDTYRLVLDDGSIRYVLSRVTQVVHDDRGQPVRLIGVMVDVTAGHETGARMVEMLESISDGFLSLDREFRIVYLNPRAELLLGMQRKVLLGQNLFDAFPKARGTRFEAAYGQVMHQRVAVRFEEYYPEPLNMWVEVNAQPSSDGMVIYFQDVTARREQELERDRLLEAERTAHRKAEAAREELAHQAAHDPLTGLLNRAELATRAQHRFGRDGPTTLLFLDLDRFKFVNDSLGHAAGDTVLIATARRLSQAVRPGDLLARLGGDEFAVALTGHDAAGAEAVARRLLDAVSAPVEFHGRTLTITASIGLAGDTSGSSFDTMLRDADVALYRAKDAGRNQLAWFDADVHAELLERIALEGELREALGSGHIELHYQPVYDARSMLPVGAEALARWTHPVRGAVPPGVFVPIAEDAGLVDRLGESVLGQACAQARAWAAVPDLRVWVNVSPRQMQAHGLAGTVLRHLRQAGVAHDRLGIEVTESALADEAHASHELALLSEAGVGIAIDDFGTGYSSLARLTTLPIDVLKIDRSFVRQISTAQGHAAVDAIVQLAHALNLKTVAEGIESAEELTALQAMGCDRLSGYLLARPAPASTLDLGVHAAAAGRRSLGGTAAPP